MSASSPSGTRVRWLLGLLALVAIFLAVHLAYLDAPYVNLESWTGAAASQAYQGDWRGAITTYQMAVSSPPVVYWSIVPFYAVFGPGEASSRAPTLLAALLTMGAIFLFTRRRFGEEPACFATALLATSPLLWAYTGLICCNDVPFTLVTALLMIAVVEADRVQSWRSHLTAGAALGATLLTKFVAGIYPIVIAILLVRGAATSRAPERFARLLKNAMAYAPGVAAAGAFYVWLYMVHGRIVSTGIAPARVDMMGSFFILAPARLAFYLCWVGLCAGPMTLVAAAHCIKALSRARLAISLAAAILVDVLALYVMQTAISGSEMALGEMRFGAAEHILGTSGLLVLEFTSLLAGEVVLLAMLLWGHERSWNGTITYWTVSIILLLSLWRGAQRYLVYLLPGLVICLADLALRPSASAWRRRVLASACAIAIAAGLAQGVFARAYFAAEGHAAADVARYVNQHGLQDLEDGINNTVLCHCSYLVEPARFAAPESTPRYVMKSYSRSDPATDAVYVRDVRLLGVVWKRYGVAPYDAANRSDSAAPPS